MIIDASPAWGKRRDPILCDPQFGSCAVHESPNSHFFPIATIHPEPWAQCYAR